jgi:beta-glucosidase-like glycosyl hydrolase/CubicO group peptidase (beta-lactamase class C family)
MRIILLAMPISAGAIAAFYLVAAAQVPFLNPHAQRWADSVYRSMTLEERIGQLFMISARSDREVRADSLLSLIGQYHPGGIMFLKGSLHRQAELTNLFQSHARHKMLIAIDAEWGLQMRIDSTPRYPRQMTAGAMPDDSSVYFMASDIARQCKRMGIHINFAPVIDINNNPLNPVINTRAFGETREQVTRLGMQYMRGLQDNGVLACGKHFPGHGNTDTDSHYALPVLNQSRQELDTMELYPFARLFQQGLGSVMTAHLFIPSLDSTPNRAASLSPLIVTQLLKDSLGFQGLVFTDALNMKGVSDYYRPGELEWLALMAGNDMLLYSENMPVAFDTIRSRLLQGLWDTLQLEQRVKKILMVKHWCGLNNYQRVKTDGLYDEINRPETSRLIAGMYARALTLLKNKKNLLPLGPLPEKGIASIVINDTLNNPFQLTLNQYATVTPFRMNKDASSDIISELADRLAIYDVVIISIHNTTTRMGAQFGITPAMNDLIAALNRRVKTITVLFGNAYCLNFLPAAALSDALLLGYEDTGYPQWIAAQVIFGARPVWGRLPVSTHDFKREAGMDLNDFAWRLKSGFAEEAGLSSHLLNRMDSLLVQSIADSVFPGCQVLVARNGIVVYEKAFGYHTYEKQRAVTITDLYDLASLTKILSTSLAVMKLYDEGRLDLNKPLSYYLPETKNTNKKHLSLHSICTHTSGLQAWIPFYKKALLQGNIFSRQPSDTFRIEVADSLWMDYRYADRIWKEIFNSPLVMPGQYLYSDLGLMLLQRVVERITGQRLDDYVRMHFYKPLGLSRLLYQPKKQYPVAEIVPTEIDGEFRNQLVHGYVHDPAAAMMGGIAGHAGLFANARSVAVIMQMLLNKGTYGGKRFLKASTVEKFTSRQSASHRRALIFDRPDEQPEKNPVAPSASAFTFGHQGFTGTSAWADPVNNLLFVFLSNRVHPSASNDRITRKNLRPQLMQLIYESFLNP